MSGLELEPVVAPANSQNFTIAYEAEVVVPDDSPASSYQYWRYGRQPNLSQPNPGGGFRAVWLT